jgi:hypothetical protein
MGSHANPNLKKSGQQELLARKSGWKRKIRHASQAERLKAMPKVKEGRLLENFVAK